jgi:hypothetical protein
MLHQKLPLMDKAVEDALLAVKEYFNAAHVFSFNPNLYHVVKLKTHTETAYLVYLGHLPSETLKHFDAKTTLKQLFALASFIVYDGKCHAPDDYTAKILKNAMIKQIPLGISALLTKADYKKQDSYLKGAFLSEGSMPKS